MIRRSILGLIVIAAWAGATVPAHADPSAIYPVTGTASPNCSLGPSGPLVVNTTVPNNGKLDQSLNGQTFTITGVFCNSPSTIRISVTELRRTVPQQSVPPGQSQAVNYRATVTGWTSLPVSVTTTETSHLGSSAVFSSAPRTQTTAKSGNLTVRVDNFATVIGTPGNSQKLIAGPYSATITVVLAPAS